MKRLDNGVGAAKHHAEPAAPPAHGIQYVPSRLLLLRGGEGFPISRVSEAHVADCWALAKRLHIHLAGFGGAVDVHRRLEGIGMIAACHPDVLQDRSLIEVKMSKSSFRSIDLKQVIVYAALAYANGIEVDQLALVNPRLGLSWRFRLESLVDEIAGMTPSRLFDSMIRFATEGLPPA